LATWAASYGPKLTVFCPSGNLAVRSPLLSMLANRLVLPSNPPWTGKAFVSKPQLFWPVVML